jgi:tetratricopeptide (TPR) repeat protein
VIRSNEDFLAERASQVAEAKKERARAEGLWRRLEASGEPKAWRDLLADSEFQSWALCEKLCRESAWLADEDAARAGDLMELALEMFPRLALEESRRAALEEYVWKHVGNVCRARGDLKSAEEAFGRAKEHFLEGIRDSLPGPLERARLALLESALLRDQGNLSEAFRQMDHAMSLSSAGDSSLVAEVLLEKGCLHRRLGPSGEVHWALSLAAERAPETADPRLLLRIHIELGNILCDLGRHGEVKTLPAPLRQEAARYPNEQSRLLSLEGRTAAGLGRLKEAEATLRKLRADPPGRAAADLALLSLEIAALYVREGKLAELRDLAGEMLRLAESPRLSREAAATLKLFCRLAGQDKLTAERVVQFGRDFPRVSGAG